MPRARKHLVCLSETPYYHVTSRCVRRAFLCGVDRNSGRSYEHRRAWIENRIRLLASLFAIDICAYAVMSNHYHLVVKLNADIARDWSDEEVLNRWTALFKGPLLVQRYRAGASLSAAERDTVHSMAAVFRQRLGSLSWFMKCLNESIARQANREDRCTGHFWEARFTSQALRSEQALFVAMAYVDLNPIRARTANTPEKSDYTSIRARLRGAADQQERECAIAGLVADQELYSFDVPLAPLSPLSVRLHKQGSRHALPMDLADYVQLVDTTGRMIARGKRGHIDPALVPIFARLGLSAEAWASGSTTFRQHYRNGNLRFRNAV